MFQSIVLKVLVTSLCRSKCTPAQHKRKTSEDAVTLYQPLYCVQDREIREVTRVIEFYFKKSGRINNERRWHRALNIPTRMYFKKNEMHTHRSLFRTDTQRGVLLGLSQERNLRSKIWWFTEFCNSHYVSHFAAFFIVTGTKISIAKSCLLFRMFFVWLFSKENNKTKNVSVQRRGPKNWGVKILK